MAGGSELLRGAEVGSSSFARLTAWLYWLMVLGVLFCLTTAPGWVISLFLGSDPSNLPYFFLCLLPFGPSVAALLFAWRRREMEGFDLRPARRFWRGYKLNALDVLRWWLPYLLLVALGSYVATHLDGTIFPLSLNWVMVGIGVVSALWAGHAMVVTALFSFRTRDVARLGAFLFIRRFPVTLLYLSLLAVVFATTYLSGIWLPLIASSVLSLLYYQSSRSAVDIITNQFVKADATEDDAGGDAPMGTSVAWARANTGNLADAVKGPSVTGSTDTIDSAAGAGSSPTAENGGVTGLAADGGLVWPPRIER
ncbi:MAG: hypothetical protein LBV30_00865 [Propionibacteriaceae bacterium]|jgi:uncharacterized membrane protein YesL|nr:hypothetical protein [Propionibacteriaceae bacterium]